MGLGLGPGERKPSTERRDEAPLLEEPEQRRGNRDRRTHQQEDVGFIEAEHRVDCVVLVKAGAGEQSTEERPEQRPVMLSFTANLRSRFEGKVSPEWPSS